MTLPKVRAGQFLLPDSESLWRLLCAITLTKIREQVRFHQRQKHGLAVEVPLSALDHEGGASVRPLTAPGPSPAEAAEFADQFAQLIASLDEQEGRLVDLKLQQYTNDEVAERLGCSERTVRRLLKRVQERLERAFALP